MRGLVLRSIAVIVIAMGAIAWSGAARAQSQPRAGCSPVTIGLPDTAMANNYASFDINAISQTFTATDTLVSEVVVWRAARDRQQSGGAQLHITALDSLGEPNAILFDGPLVLAEIRDEGEPEPFVFSIDPPFSLPGPGTYALTFSPESCSRHSLLAYDGPLGYPGGSFWAHARGCPIRFNSTAVPDADLIFSITFCDTSTPVRRATWGKVKVMYR